MCTSQVVRFKENETSLCIMQNVADVTSYVRWRRCFQPIRDVSLCVCVGHVKLTRHKNLKWKLFLRYKIVLCQTHICTRTLNAMYFSLKHLPKKTNMRNFRFTSESTRWCAYQFSATLSSSNYFAKKMPEQYVAGASERMHVWCRATLSPFPRNRRGIPKDCVNVNYVWIHRHARSVCVCLFATCADCRW